MFVQAINHGFVANFEGFAGAVEAIFDFSELVTIKCQGVEGVIPLQREIQLSDETSFKAWLESEALNLIGFDEKGWVNKN
ncbi:hypothetical protein [Thiomicrorhabdus indica]|uniref:hypothetical protein n=1 Tax=Thiomicrorhabdus indica TaxID=2267253 RepID=UPI00102D939B|nr:hypothetical protein [Thiomicrorhabdus indica]